MLNPLPVVAADIRRSRAGVLAVVVLIAIAVALGVAVSAQERALRTGSARAADAVDLFVGASGRPMHTVVGDARALIAVFSVATQALVIAAVLLAVFASVALRRRQLAILRALGASRAYVFAVVWSHVTLMFALGSGLGLLGGWLGAGALSAAVSTRTGLMLSARLAPQEVIMAAAVVGVGMLLAAIPSWSSCGQPVAAGLRN